MKKSLVVALVASLALAACSREEKTTTTEEESKTVETQPHEGAPADQPTHEQHQGSISDKIDHAAQDVHNAATDVTNSLEQHNQAGSTTTTTTTTTPANPAAAGTTPGQDASAAHDATTMPSTTDTPAHTD